MKKVLSNSKLPDPSKFVRRVLSRNSNVSKNSQERNSSQATNSENMKSKSDRTTLELELGNLKDQLSILQLTVNNMQEDAEKREQALANLAREKQQLSTDLKRERRSTCSLKQQLEDERHFYYKEKEQYCNEMNDCKKLKKKISESIESKKKDLNEDNASDVIECKNQIFKLKTALNQTLEANYNLSVKFLRMKNTKISLKIRLKKQQCDHDEAMKDLQVKINTIKNDIADVVDKRFMLPISPSNKKYLQIIKQNGVLMHENLCLQMEVDRLTGELEVFKYSQTRQESKKRLKHAQSCPQHTNKVKPTTSNETTKTDKKTPSKITVKPANETHKIEPKKKKQQPLTTPQEEENIQYSPKVDSGINVVKIYERREIEGLPEIIMLTPSNELELKEDKTDAQSISTKTSSNYEQISSTHIGTELSDFTQTTISREAIRTQSAPEIVQASLFVSTDKIQ